jgi:hypothetical protein
MRKQIACVILGLLLSATTVTSIRAVEMDWQVVSSSGSNSLDSPSVRLGSTVGQVAIGVQTSASLSSINGFWQDLGTGGGGGGCCGLYTGGFPGNTDCDTLGKRNLADITKLIDHVYISKLPLCCAENGNVDGDALGKHNLADITKLIDHVYISKTEVPACL